MLFSPLFTDSRFQWARVYNPEFSVLSVTMRAALLITIPVVPRSFRRCFVMHTLSPTANGFTRLLARLFGRLPRANATLARSILCSRRASRLRLSLNNLSISCIDLSLSIRSSSSSRTRSSMDSILVQELWESTIGRFTVWLNTLILLKSLRR